MKLESGILIGKDKELSKNSHSKSKEPLTK